MGLRLSRGVEPAICGVIFGAIGVVAGGFTMGGWVTSGAAHEQADIAAAMSAQSVMIEVCVAQALADPARTRILGNLSTSNQYVHEQIVMDAGWATMPWDPKPNNGVAEKCGDRLLADLK